MSFRFERWSQRNVASITAVQAAIVGVSPLIILATEERDKWAARAQINLNDKEALSQAIIAQSELEKVRTSAWA